MTTEPWVVGVLLLAAVTHALWNAALKSSNNRLFSITTIMATSGSLFLPVLFFVDLPAPESWPYMTASVVIHLGYYYALVWAYRHGDLSAAYPVARGGAPLLVALGAALFAGQILSPYETAGIFLASGGISMIAFEKGLPRGDLFKPFASAFAVSLLIAGYTVSDGMGLRRTPEALPYIAWLFVLAGIPLLAIVLSTRPADYFSHFSVAWKTDIMGGVFSALAYALVLYVLSFSGMAHVSALRETSVLFAVIIGAIKLKEHFGLFRWTAAVLVTAGIVIMQFGPLGK